MRRQKTLRKATRRMRAPTALMITAVIACMCLATAVNSVAAVNWSSYPVERVCAASQSFTARCTAVTRRPASATGSSVASAGIRGYRSAMVKQPVTGTLGPADLHAAYAIPRSTSASALQTIAVVDAFDDPTVESDLEVYDKQYGLPRCTMENGCFRKLNQEGHARPLPPVEGFWASEISADVQMAHAICQNCHILLVEAKSAEFIDLGEAVNTAVAAGATEISNSYESVGEEAPSASTLNSTYYNHPGVVITASSGDCGYLNLQCEAASVSFPASAPNVIAVGATALTEGEGTWSSTAWFGTGSGCSTVFAAPSWQLALPTWGATGCGDKRLVADVATVGAPETGVSVYDSTPEVKNGTAAGWEWDGGTSVSSPIVASEFALDGGSHGVAYPAQTLYDHLGDRQALYDVATGANGSCGGLMVCEADAGYDGPSGVGSPVGLAAFSVIGSPTNTTPPTILGSVAKGQTLVEEHGQWSGGPDHYSYQWARCDRLGANCQKISYATASRYALTSEDVGYTVRVQEVASNTSGQGDPAISAATAIVGTEVR